MNRHFLTSQICCSHVEVPWLTGAIKKLLSFLGSAYLAQLAPPKTESQCAAVQHLQNYLQNPCKLYLCTLPEVHDTAWLPKRTKMERRGMSSPRLNRQKLNDKVAKSWKTAEFVESVAGNSMLAVLL